VSVEYLPWPTDARLVETGSFVADIEKIRKALRWAPQTTLQDGLLKIKRLP